MPLRNEQRRPFGSTLCYACFTRIGALLLKLHCVSRLFSYGFSRDLAIHRRYTYVLVFALSFTGAGYFDKGPSRGLDMAYAARIMVHIPYAHLGRALVGEISLCPLGVAVS